MEHKILEGCISLNENLKQFDESQEENCIVKCFFRNENREHTDRMIMTNVRKIFLDVKEKVCG